MLTLMVFNEYHVLLILYNNCIMIQDGLLVLLFKTRVEATTIPFQVKQIIVVITDIIIVIIIIILKMNIPHAEIHLTFPLIFQKVCF